MLDEAILAALSKAPAERPTASELAAALEQARFRLPSTAPVAQPPVRRRSSRPASFAVLAYLALAFLVGLGAGTMVGVRFPVENPAPAAVERRPSPTPVPVESPTIALIVVEPTETPTNSPPATITPTQTPAPSATPTPTASETPIPTATPPSTSTLAPTSAPTSPAG